MEDCRARPRPHSDVFSWKKKEFTIKNNFQHKQKVLGSEVLLTKAL